MSPPCHTSRRLLESSKNALTCTGRPVRAGRGRKQNARPVGSRECSPVADARAFGSSSANVSADVSVSSSAATAAHGTSRIPNFSRPVSTSERNGSAPSACATTKARRDEALPTAFVSDAEELSKTSSNLDADSGSILAAAPFSACAAEARANAPRAETSDRDAMASVAIFATESVVGASSPTRHAEISTAATDFKNSMSSTASSAKSRRSLRTSSVPYDAFESFELSACAFVRSGNRNVVPRNSERASHPKARNGANWSRFFWNTSFFTKSTRLPGFELETFGRNVACGSKYTTCLPEMNEGTSVRWYTELNPTPKRPVLPTCSRFTESPMELMDAKSDSRNTESLYTSNEGPWNCAKRAYASVSVPCVRSSRHTFTTVAPASSCRFRLRRRRVRSASRLVDW